MPSQNRESIDDLVRMSESIWQWPIPTPTLPPAFVTNSYVIQSQGEALIVDCGSSEPTIADACTAHLQTLGVTRVAGLVATHYHRDHTDGLPHLARQYQAPIYVHAADLAPALQSMKCDDSIPVLPLPDGFVVGGALHIDVVHKPGHTHGHVHLVIPDEGVILVGDHLAGDGSVWIGPPDGHMEAYFDALAHIASVGCKLAGPGHGTVLQDAKEAANALLQRRLGREAQICAALTDWHTRQDVFLQVYGNAVAPVSSEVARRTLSAHLQRLVDVGRVERRYTMGAGFEYRVKSALQGPRAADTL